MLKALAAPSPGRYFQLMIDFAAGRNWLPELFRMPQIPAGPPEYHPEGDLLIHSLQVLERVAAITNDPLARFCAFFHDIGKLSTDPACYPRHHGHEETGFRSAALLTRRLALANEYGRALAWVSRLHGNVNRLDRLRDSTGIRIAEQAIKAGIKDILPLLAAADKPGDYCTELWELLTRIASMTVTELGIEAERLAMLPPEQRAAFILQRRVDRLKAAKTSVLADPSEDRDLL
jgi:tRNA nucleotidyltransferase (CCA-adding enzyme)